MLLEQLNETERALLEHVFESLGARLFDAHNDLSSIGAVPKTETRVSDAQLDVVVSGPLSFPCSCGIHQVEGAFELHHGMSTSRKNFMTPWLITPPLTCSEKLRLSVTSGDTTVLSVALDSFCVDKLRAEFIQACGLTEAVRKSADKTFAKAWHLVQGWFASEEQAAARRLEARLKGVYFERALQGI